MNLQRIYSNENVSVGDKVIHLRSKHIGIVLSIVGNGYVIVRNVTNKNQGAWICFTRYIKEPIKMEQIEGKFTSNLLNKTSVFPASDDENLIKVSLTRNGDTEGIWVQISSDDLEDYKSDKKDKSYKRIAICRNDSLNGVPFGAVFPYKLNGRERPISIMEHWLDGATFVVLEKFREPSQQEQP